MAGFTSRHCGRTDSSNATSSFRIPAFRIRFLGGIPLAGQPPSIVRAHPDIVMPYTQARVGGRRSHVDELGEAAGQLFASNRAQPVSQPRSERPSRRRAARPEPPQRHAARVGRAIAEPVSGSERHAELSAAPIQRERRLHAGRGAERDRRRVVAAPEQLRSLAGMGTVDGRMCGTGCSRR